VSESAVGRRYRAWLESELAHRSGVTFVDLSAVADDDAFIDGVHLGPKGAARFSEELAKLLRARSASETTRDSVEP
jgi:lysophospholipase L1-like esterase